MPRYGSMKCGTLQFWSLKISNLFILLLLLLLLLLLSTWFIIITSNDDIQPSTVVSNQLPSGLVLVILIIHG